MKKIKSNIAIMKILFVIAAIFCISTIYADSNYHIKSFSNANSKEAGFRYYFKDSYHQYSMLFHAFSYKKTNAEENKYNLKFQFGEVDRFSGELGDRKPKQLLLWLSYDNQNIVENNDPTITVDFEDNPTKELNKTKCDVEEINYSARSPGKKSHYYSCSAPELFTRNNSETVYYKAKIIDEHDKLIHEFEGAVPVWFVTLEQDEMGYKLKLKNTTKQTVKLNFNSSQYFYFDENAERFDIFFDGNKKILHSLNDIVFDLNEKNYEIINPQDSYSIHLDLNRVPTNSIFVVLPYTINGKSYEYIINFEKDESGHWLIGTAGGVIAGTAGLYGLYGHRHRHVQQNHPVHVIPAPVVQAPVNLGDVFMAAAAEPKKFKKDPYNDDGAAGIAIRSSEKTDTSSLSDDHSEYYKGNKDKTLPDPLRGMFAPVAAAY
jgi:hypothetical protein